MTVIWFCLLFVFKARLRIVEEEDKFSLEKKLLEQEETVFIDYLPAIIHKNHFENDDVKLAEQEMMSDLNGDKIADE